MEATAVPLAAAGNSGNGAPRRARPTAPCFNVKHPAAPVV